MRDSIIAGLDVGSNNIRLIVGQKIETGLNIIGLAEIPSGGINRGVINSVEDAVSCISEAEEKAERMTGVPIEKAYIAISGAHIISNTSRGVIAIAKADGEIKEDDVDRAIEAAQIISSPPNYEVLHVIPLTFSVDNQKGIRDPIGMSGIRLEVEVLIIHGLSTQIKNLTKVVYRAGLDVEDLVVGVLASAEAVLSKRQKELGAAVLNIGSSTASLAVFEEGDVIYTKIIPIGSAHITSDLAIGLRSSLDTAEEIKIKYGNADPQKIHKNEDIDLSGITEGEIGIVSRRHTAEIIEARVEEIFKLADSELAKIEKSGKLPAGIILTGGGSKLDGIIEVARRIFRLPASIGYPRGDIITAIDKIHDPCLTTALGLVLWGNNLQHDGAGGKKGGLSKFSVIDETTGRIKKWFKSFLP